MPVLFCSAAVLTFKYNLQCCCFDFQQIMSISRNPCSKSQSQISCFSKDSLVSHRSCFFKDFFPFERYKLRTNLMILKTFVEVDVSSVLLDRSQCSLEIHYHYHIRTE